MGAVAPGDAVIRPIQGPPRSTLADFMRAIVERFDAVGATRSATNPGGVELLVGEKWLRAEGFPPRVVLVRTSGKIGGPPRIGGGDVASVAQGVTAYVWGAETADDLGRYAAQDALLDQLTNVVRAVAPGRAEISTLNPLVQTNVVTFGEEIQALITWSRGVPTDAAVWRAATTPSDAPDPARPNGSTGLVFEFEASTAPEEK